MRADVEGVASTSLPGVVVVRKDSSQYLPATSMFVARGALGTVIAEDFARIEVEIQPREVVVSASVVVVRDPAALLAYVAEGRRALDAVAEIRKLVDAAEGRGLICAKLDEILGRHEL